MTAEPTLRVERVGADGYRGGRPRAIELTLASLPAVGGFYANRPLDFWAGFGVSAIAAVGLLALGVFLLPSNTGAARALPFVAGGLLAGLAWFMWATLRPSRLTHAAQRRVRVRVDAESIERREEGDDAWTRLAATDRVSSAAVAGGLGAPTVRLELRDGARADLGRFASRTDAREAVEALYELLDGEPPPDR